MKLALHYYGLLAEICGTSKAEMEVEVEFISDLRKHLETLHPGLKDVSYQFAQNEVLCSEADAITAQQIALLPPFSGG